MTFWKRHMLKSEEVLTTVGNRKILRGTGTVLYLHYTSAYMTVCQNSHILRGTGTVLYLHYTSAYMTVKIHTTVHSLKFTDIIY